MIKILQIIGFFISFILVLFLISKKVNMGLALLISSVIMGLFSKLNIINLFESILTGFLSTISIQLMLIVGLISGLGYIMKKTGDLDLIINSLSSLLKNNKVIMMVIPAIIGTLNIPGGAILSAPMIEECGNKNNLKGVEKNSINLFFRHIGFFVYPLFPPIILLVELFKIEVIDIIKYTSIIMVFGIITAYFVMFKGLANSTIPPEETQGVKASLADFFFGFLAILVILILALIFKLPFHYSVLIGVIIALGKNIPKSTSFLIIFFNRIKEFIFKGIDYQLVFTIAGLMAFKSVLETTGIIENLTQIVITYGIPLVILISGLSFIAGYISGVHVAAIGMLAPLFAPMIPTDNIAIYAALLFTFVNIGYLISPLHLCLVLGNEYFQVTIGPVYRKLLFPIVVMSLVSLILTFFFTI